MKKVESDSVEAIDHDPVSRTMTVKFWGGGSYLFHDVSASEHEKFVRAESIGRHFQQNIRGKFRTTKL